MSDLDGTLMQPDSRISATSVRLLNESVASGKLFSVATARTPATVAPILSGVDMRLPAIVITGAALFDTRTASYSDVRRFHPEAALHLTELYRATGTPTFLFTLADDLINIYHIGGELLPLQREFVEERLDSPFKCFHIDPRGADTLPADIENTILFYTMIPDAKAASTYELTRRLEGVRAQYYHDIYGPEVGILEAFAPAATKAAALRTLARKCGADLTVCFGDNINDLPMMREADIAVAVDNALPEVKAAADIVIGPNTEDSVARFIADFKIPG